MDLLTVPQFLLVYNAFSFTIAVMGAATVFFFMRSFQVAPAYRTALTVTGLVTLIACYHYFRILHSWEGAYVVNGSTLTPDRLYSAWHDSHPPAVARIAALGQQA